MQNEPNRPRRRREQYKHIVSSGSALVLLCILTLLFGSTWYVSYYPDIALPFYRRGNWVVIAIYAALVYLFFKVYGGFKVGYLRRTDMIFSQLMSIFGANVLAYLQISVIARDFAAVKPMLLLTAAEMVVVICWTLLSQNA